MNQSLWYKVCLLTVLAVGLARVLAVGLARVLAIGLARVLAVGLAGVLAAAATGLLGVRGLVRILGRGVRVLGTLVARDDQVLIVPLRVQECGRLLLGRQYHRRRIDGRNAAVHTAATASAHSILAYKLRELGKGCVLGCNIRSRMHIGREELAELVRVLGRAAAHSTTVVITCIHLPILTAVFLRTTVKILCHRRKLLALRQR